MANQQKAVICIETGKVYYSIAEASRDTGASMTCICTCCSNPSRTAKGYHWQYFTDMNGKPIVTKWSTGAVMCVETGKVYTSVTEASKLTGINACCISRCCRGLQKKSGGYHWKKLAESED